MLKAQPGFDRDILVFGHSDSLKAMEAIVARKPHLVVIHRSFMELSRGAAIINQLRTDPHYSQPQIRVLDHRRTTSVWCSAGRRSGCRPTRRCLASRSPTPTGGHGSSTGLRSIVRWKCGWKASSRNSSICRPPALSSSPPHRCARVSACPSHWRPRSRTSSSSWGWWPGRLRAGPRLARPRLSSWRGLHERRRGRARRLLRAVPHAVVGTGQLSAAAPYRPIGGR